MPAPFLLSWTLCSYIHPISRSGCRQGANFFCPSLPPNPRQRSRVHIPSTSNPTPNPPDRSQAARRIRALANSNSNPLAALQSPRNDIPRAEQEGRRRDTLPTHPCEDYPIWCPSRPTLVATRCCRCLSVSAGADTHPEPKRCCHTSASRVTLACSTRRDRGASADCTSTTRHAPLAHLPAPKDSIRCRRPQGLGKLPSVAGPANRPSARLHQPIAARLDVCP